MHPLAPKAAGKFGRYELLERLGVGGMAEVWLAQISGVSGFKKTLVVKTMHPNLAESPEFVKMFVKEASLAARLNHPNIVQIYDLGEIDGRYFIAMEYIPGRSFRQIRGRIRKRFGDAPANFPPWLLLNAVARACDGLHYSHEFCDADGTRLGLVHRDISPENIMVSFAGGVKLLDFGVAKMSAIEQTHSSALVGKFGYMSPQQARGERTDCRADVYALGVILYELLTGARPFQGANEVVILQNTVAGNFVHPQEAEPSIHAELARIILKAMAYEPANRYQGAAELQTDVLAYLRSADLACDQNHIGMFVSSLFPESTEIPAHLRNALAAGPAGPVSLPPGPALESLHPTDSRSMPPSGVKPVRISEVGPISDEHGPADGPLTMPLTTPPAEPAHAIVTEPAARGPLLPAPPATPAPPRLRTPTLREGLTPPGLGASSPPFTPVDLEWPEIDGSDLISVHATAPRPSAPAALGAPFPSLATPVPVLASPEASPGESSPVPSAPRITLPGVGLAGAEPRWPVAMGAPAPKPPAPTAPEIFTPRAPPVLDGPDPFQVEASIPAFDGGRDSGAPSIAEAPAGVDIFAVRRPSQDALSPDGLFSSRRSGTPAPPPVGTPDLFAARPRLGDEEDAVQATPPRAKSEVRSQRWGPYEKLPAAAEAPRSTSAADHFEKGLAHVREKELELALAEWERAAALDPTNRAYQSNLQRLRDKLKSK